jgi:hypothetical protein
MGLLILFSAFTGSRPAMLLETDNCPLNGFQEGSLDDLSNSTLADDGDKRLSSTVIPTQGLRLLDHRLPATMTSSFLRSPDNPERDILTSRSRF